MEHRKHHEIGEPIVVESNVWQSRLLIGRYLTETARKKDAALLFARLPDGSRFSGAGDGQLRRSDTGDLQIRQGKSWLLVDGLSESARKNLTLTDDSIAAMRAFFEEKQTERPYISPPRFVEEKQRATRRESSAGPFEYNKSEARRLGLEQLEIKGNAAAQRLIEQVISRAIDIETPAGKTKFVQEWQSACPDIPMPCVLKDDKGNIITDLDSAVLDKSDFWYLTQLSSNKIIRNLNGDPVPQLPQFDQDQVVLVDNWTGTDYNAPDAEQKHKSSLLKELLGEESTVNIKRQDIDAALWQGDPTNRVPSKKHKEILQRLGVSLDQFELRCIRQDEYARLAPAKNWGQKALWVNFDHYFFAEDGVRSGLDGGDCDYGGVSLVGYNWRDSASGDLSVRLVLSRKSA